MSEVATVFDFETKKFFKIPSAELAPGLMRAKIQIEDGSFVEAWVDPSKLKVGKPQRESLGPEMDGRVRLIKEALDPVYSRSLEDWTYGFLCDQNPGHEIEIWERLVGVLGAAQREIGEEKGRQIFDLVLLLINSGSASLEQIFKVRRDGLSREDAEVVIRLYLASAS